MTIFSGEDGSQRIHAPRLLEFARMAPKTILRICTISLMILLVVGDRGLAQAIYVPVDDPIYDFLDRMHISSVITWDGAILPATRNEIALVLLQADGRRSMLSRVEDEELDYYMREYSYELKADGYSKNEIDPRWHLFSYRDSIFSVKLDPILGESVSEGLLHRVNGAKFDGYVSSDVAYGFHFNDNQEVGKNIDRTKAFTPVTGSILCR